MVLNPHFSGIGKNNFYLWFSSVGQYGLPLIRSRVSLYAAIEDKLFHRSPIFDPFYAVGKQPILLVERLGTPRSVDPTKITTLKISPFIGLMNDIVGKSPKQHSSAKLQDFAGRVGQLGRCTLDN